MSQWRHYWYGWVDLAQVLIQKCVAMGTLTVWFYSNLLQRYNLIFLTNLQIFVRIDWEITSQWRHYCFGGLDLSESPLQENVAMATAKYLRSNFYLLTNSYIFSREVTKFGWIIFLPLWVMGKKPQGWCPTPQQDRVKVLISVKSYQRKTFGGRLDLLRSGRVNTFTAYCKVIKHC